MNKFALFLLGCPSFFALMLLAPHPALAKKLTPQELANPNLRQADIQRVNPGAAQEDPTPTFKSNEKLKQVAMQMFGCDCPSCQAMASQLLLQGNLPQPQS